MGAPGPQPQRQVGTAALYQVAVTQETRLTGTCIPGWRAGVGVCPFLSPEALVPRTQCGYEESCGMSRQSVRADKQKPLCLLLGLPRASQAEGPQDQGRTSVLLLPGPVSSENTSQAVCDLSH